MKAKEYCFATSFFLACVLYGIAASAAEKSAPTEARSQSGTTDSEIRLTLNKDDDLAYFANFSRIVATHKDEERFVTIYQLSEVGECDGPEHCPFQTLYIAVSNYGEAPEHALYLSPRAFDWKFLKWIPASKNAECESCSVFEIEGTHIALPNGKILKSAKFRIGVEPLTKVDDETYSYIKEIK